jgi:hypothetical protein
MSRNTVQQSQAIPIQPSVIPKAGNLLMKQLAIPLSNQKTVAKWLVISSKLDVELTPLRSYFAQPVR